MSVIYSTVNRFNQHIRPWSQECGGEKMSCTPWFLSLLLTSLSRSRSLAFFLSISHKHTLRYLRSFQTCCLGDRSLFRCVVKETKMGEKKLFGEIFRKSICRVGTRQKKCWSLVGWVLPIKYIFQREKGVFYWFCDCVINIKMDPGCCK